MSNFIENQRYRILIGQAAIILYSLFATLLGRNYKTFILVFLLIIAVSLIQQRKAKNPLGQEKVPPERVLEGKRLYREENARELQQQDKDVLKDFQEQSKFTMYNTLGMVAAMLYFFLFWNHIDALYAWVAGYVGEGKLAEFLAFLIFFEGLFIINQAAYFFALKKVGKVTMIQMVSSYTVTDKGIVLEGLVRKSALTFPLPDDVEVVVDEKRRFVELVKEGKRTRTRIRLYARNPKRLAEVIKRYGQRR